MADCESDIEKESKAESKAEPKAESNVSSPRRALEIVDRKATSLQERVDKHAPKVQKASNKTCAWLFIVVGCIGLLMGVIGAAVRSLPVAIVFIPVSIILLFYGRYLLKKAGIQEIKNKYVKRRNAARVVSHKKCEKCKQTGKMIVHFAIDCNECDGTGKSKTSTGCCPRKCNKCKGRKTVIVRRIIMTCYKCGGEGNIRKSNMEVLICCCKWLYRCAAIITLNYGYEVMLDCFCTHCLGSGCDSCLECFCESCCESCCDSCCDFDAKVTGIFSDADKVGDLTDIIVEKGIEKVGDQILKPENAIINSRNLYKRGFDYRAMGALYYAFEKLELEQDVVSGVSSPSGSVPASPILVYSASPQSPASPVTPGSPADPGSPVSDISGAVEDEINSEFNDKIQEAGKDVINALMDG